MRRQWQKVVLKGLTPDYSATLRQFVLARLARWPLSLFPRLRADRALRILPALRALVAPRVLAALVRTHWNGWVTARRLQHTRGATCCFGCSAPDSIEHYANCVHVSSFALSYLRLPRPVTPPQRMADFLALDIPSPVAHSDVLLLKTLRTATVYHVHNRWRHSAAPPQVTRGMLPQTLREMLRGHDRSTAPVAGLYALPA